MPPYKYTKETFEQEANKTHNGRYKYDLIVQPHLSKKNKIVCDIHGIFEQKGQHHLAGAGCPKCANESLSGTSSPAYRKMIKVLKIDGENVVTQPLMKTVKFKCHIHGDVEMSRYRFRKYGSVCDKCEPKRQLSSKQLSNFQLYKQQVRRFTERSWNNRQGYINHHKLSRGHTTYHIDHNFSVYDGFVKNIPPYIIGHWSNLELIPYDENIRKGKFSIIEAELLYCLFYYNYNKHDNKRIF